MVKLFFLAIYLLTIKNSQCRKSTYCPKVEPMSGFQWQPVIFRKDSIILSKKFLNYIFLVFGKLVSLYIK